MKIITNAGIAAVLLSLSACGTVPGVADLSVAKSGTQISQEQMAKLIDNKSTQDDVVAVVGEPNRKAQVGQKEIWYYDFIQVGVPYIGKNIHEATAFEFNQKGILLTHYKTQE
ncbi:MAG TPA: hypothetical protein VFN66_08915 [Burkholderiales bacterium]|nr:hypothetical protein [Burkholderiales bacterium]